MPSPHPVPRSAAPTRRSSFAGSTALATAFVPFAALATLVAAPVLSAQAPAATVRRADSSYVAQARADSVRRPYVEADVQFMSGMIGHHAQAILMANMAPSHGASPAVRTLAERIINAQRDEIGIMQTWLRDREKPVPDPVHPSTSSGAGMPGMPGMAHMGHMGHMGHDLMPGMLTEAQIRELDAARGPEFDKLFLRYMIQHHNGAIGMVKTLFESYGAGQDEIVFKFATDVNVDQSTEVARMQRMLARLVFDAPAR